MEKIYKKIDTEIGYIDAKRDAIYLDSFEQQGNSLNLVGEVNSNFCQEKSKEYIWYKYCLNIEGVKEYRAINIEDYYKKEINTPSSFSEVLEISSGKTDLRTVIIETYDWAYIILCKRFELKIIDRR